ncbi:MAG: glycosyltransferase family A protein [Gemmiger sp.]|uniref:glycosyltransferase family A protein n=1 Tax=Gemmiger sp. TaxID=2049027 RepID=UPI002E795D39|nr:glycosyltransferase family A protein [Gemmiger sp.]MEE0800083.1 glycosyltransferase family A protein [Gemmiger sp.]
MSNPMLITVVVPIYNVERYLEECLDSLVNQSTRNFQVILVNDGSRDGSGAIARRYAERDPEHFTYVEQPNAGLGAARNTGMRLVKTPYLEFLDSDDWLKPRAIENVERALLAQTEEVDIVFTAPTVFDMATRTFSEWSDNDRLARIFEGRTVTSPAECPDMYALEASVNRSVWNTEFLRRNHFAFPEGVKWEDVFPHFYLFHLARRCIMVEQAGFFYRINSGNQITSLSSTARLDIVPVFSTALLYAMENQWTETEISYILQMMMDFIRWSVYVSQPKVRTELVRSLHGMFGGIPGHYLRAYLRQRRPSADTRLFLSFLRRPGLYHLLENAHVVDFFERNFHRLERLRRH